MTNRAGRFGTHWGECAPEFEQPYSGLASSDNIPDHADAFASILRRYAKLISQGRSVEDCAAELLPIVRVAARRV